MSRFANFKNWSFSSDQGAVQINSNLVWSISCEGRVANKNLFGYSLPRTKIWVFIRNFANFAKCDFLRILEIGLFHRVKELSKSNQTWHIVCPVYVEYKTKRNFAIACLRQKLGFRTVICDYRE